MCDQPVQFSNESDAMFSLIWLLDYSDLKAAATWEVDRAGSVTGVPLSMYLLSGTFFLA